MKKIFPIIILGLLWSGNGYGNTPLEQYVFEKLYDEYSKCTVYYKFLARGVERKKEVATLTKEDRSFIDKMNIKLKNAETNVFFFALKLNISNKDVQTNIEKIYKSFLNIGGRDYSKTASLSDKYYVLCSKSLADPKSRMIYWDIEFQKKFIGI